MSADQLSSRESVTPRRRVVLIHGLAANRLFLMPLASRLRQAGFEVETWGFQTFRNSFANLIPEFERRFEELKERVPADEELFIVAHSMGAVLVRLSLRSVQLPSLRRVVFLSPPLRGSFFASIVGRSLRFWTRLIEELADREDSYINQLEYHDPDGIEFGVIAADWDYVLTKTTTHFQKQVDHISVPSRHTGLLLRSTSAMQVIHFLQHGCFHRDSCSACSS